MFVGRALAAEMRGGTRSPKPAVRKVFPSLPRPALPPPLPLLPPPGRAAIPKAPCPAEQHSSARWVLCIAAPQSPAAPPGPGQRSDRGTGKGRRHPPWLLHLQ